MVVDFLGKLVLELESYSRRSQVNLEALDKAVIPDQEESYDWILVHQLRQIMHEWDGWLDADNASTSTNSASVGIVCSRRRRPAKKLLATNSGMSIR
jgi:hypothetical protein